MFFKLFVLAFLKIVIFAKFNTCENPYNTYTTAKDSWNIRDSAQFRSEKFWYNDAQTSLYERLRHQPNMNRAKNVIYFMGDGMSLSTVTASRIYEGQKRGIIGERNRLFFEKFPYIGMSKTYCSDRQVADSASSATAYLCGVKANYYTIGVTSHVSKNDCYAARDENNQLESIVGWAQNAGKSTGIVTTTRVTHASPAGVYAHTSNRDFESDYDVRSQNMNPDICKDVAAQLIENNISQRLNVIFGGGIKKFLPNATVDGMGNPGERLDGRNLIAEWLAMKNGNARYVSNREQLLNTNIEDTDYLMGLFSADHLAYNLDNDLNQPSLAEMTQTAIALLQKNERGFFLFVEGGRIDQAHHENRATKALDETVQLARAIQRAYKLTDPKDTLIVVTADHGHTMTINGAATIGNSITGLVTEFSNIDGLPYSTLSYANGPSFKNFYTSVGGNVQRVDLRSLRNLDDNDFQYPAAVPRDASTHSGADVPVYTNGPWAHLFTGTMEQSCLPSFIGFAACIGPGLHSCQL